MYRGKACLDRYSVCLSSPLVRDFVVCTRHCCLPSSLTYSKSTRCIKLVNRTSNRSKLQIEAPPTSALHLPAHDSIHHLPPPQLHHHLYQSTTTRSTLHLPPRFNLPNRNNVHLRPAHQHARPENPPRRRLCARSSRPLVPDGTRAGCWEGVCSS